jgi:hypothetical protein
VSMSHPLIGKGPSAMCSKCANAACTASYHCDEGKLFRLDLDIANAAGLTEHKTAYIWLCSECARKMEPRAEIGLKAVRVLLAAVHGPQARLAAPVN